MRQYYCKEERKNTGLAEILTAGLRHGYASVRAAEKHMACLSGIKKRSLVLHFRHFRHFLRMLAIAWLAAGAPLRVAQAGESGGNAASSTAYQPATVNARWKQECSACHIAFPPGLLQAESWQNIMRNLEKHFGVNASLTAQENNEIAAFLVKNASTRWRYSTAPARISEATWFKRWHSEHESAWKSPLVKTPANCASCHKNSDNGDFVSDRGSCGGTCHTT